MATSLHTGRKTRAGRGHAGGAGYSGSQSGGGGGPFGNSGSLQAHGQHAGKGTEGFQRFDERVTEMIHEALTDDEHLDATHITIGV